MQVEGLRMRVLTACMVFWCLAGMGCTQERSARIELDDGRVVSGPVVTLDSASITLAVEGRSVTFATAQVRHCRFSRLPRDDGDAVGDSHAAWSTQVALPNASAAASDRSRAVVAANPKSSPLERRLVAMESRFPWLQPTEPRQWACLSVSIFALLSFALHLTARLCGAEQRGFGRSASVSLALLLAFVGQLALVPDGLVPLLVASVGNGCLLIAVLRRVYGQTTATATVALGLLVLQGGALWFVLRVLDTALRALGGCPA